MKGHGILRFVKKPELKETPNGTKFSNFFLCWNERRKDANGVWVDTPNFYEFEVWAEGAESLCKTYDQGDPIYVDQYTPRQHTWIDKTSGEKRSKIVFRLDHFSQCPRMKAKDETKNSVE